MTTFAWSLPSATLKVKLHDGFFYYQKETIIIKAPEFLLHFTSEGQTVLEDYILPADICNKEYLSASLVYVLTVAKLI